MTIMGFMDDNLETPDWRDTDYPNIDYTGESSDTEDEGEDLSEVG